MLCLQEEVTGKGFEVVGRFYLLIVSLAENGALIRAAIANPVTRIPAISVITLELLFLKVSFTFPYKNAYARLKRLVFFESHIEHFSRSRD